MWLNEWPERNYIQISTQYLGARLSARCSEGHRDEKGKEFTFEGSWTLPQLPIVPGTKWHSINVLLMNVLLPVIWQKYVQYTKGT